MNISDVIRDVEWVEKQQLVAKRGHSGRNFPVTSRLIERHRANSVKGQILTGQEEMEIFYTTKIFSVATKKNYVEMDKVSSNEPLLK